MNTISVNSNFGFNGQIIEEEWDSFLCFGRKCKQRRQERHKARIEKRKLKNDQMRAETESLRTDIKITDKKGTQEPKAAEVITKIVEVAANSPQPVAQPTQSIIQASPPPQQAGMGNGVIMAVVAVLLIGGGIAYKMKMGKQPIPVLPPQ